jgi:hypothetical protein
MHRIPRSLRAVDIETGGPTPPIVMECDNPKNAMSRNSNFGVRADENDDPSTIASRWTKPTSAASTGVSGELRITQSNTVSLRSTKSARNSVTHSAMKRQSRLQRLLPALSNFYGQLDDDAERRTMSSRTCALYIGVEGFVMGILGSLRLI